MGVCVCLWVFTGSCGLCRVVMYAGGMLYGDGGYWMVLVGYWMVLVGIRYCWWVLDGVGGYWMVLVGIGWCW